MTNKSKVVFKTYSPNQISLLPPSLEELIAEHHPVRIVDQVLEQINIDPLLKKYKGGGSSSYHPRMLLKVLVYAYLNNEYSSRRIEAGLKENIHYMWLSGMSLPDHNTINRFRSERLKQVLKEIFSQVVLLLSESGYVNLKEIYIDGTKMEANANRYTFVWGKAIKNHKEKIKKQLEELWSYTQQVAQEELKDQSPTQFDKIDGQKVKNVIEQINEALKDKEVPKKIKQKLNYAKKNWPGKLDHYQEQEKILGKRGSYSKTDTDATFMRMKEDHMKNGQLKAAYNWQISTNDQFIVNYTLHQTPGDTTTLQEHLDEHKHCYGESPLEATADAGYGSEENYQYLEKENIEAYVKYNYFHQEQSKKYKQDPFRVENLYYNSEKDCYYCPMGQAMANIGQRTRITANGHKQTYTAYRAQRCQGCPLRSQCHKGKTDRVIEVNHQLNHLKAKARERLTSDKGLMHRSKRPCDVEPVFGNIKHNKNFKRFMLRGIKKIEVETGLLSLAHNIAKLAKKSTKKQPTAHPSEKPYLKIAA